MRPLASARHTPEGLSCRALVLRESFPEAVRRRSPLGRFLEQRASPRDQRTSEVDGAGSKRRPPSDRKGAVRGAFQTLTERIPLVRRGGLQGPGQRFDARALVDGFEFWMALLAGDLKPRLLIGALCGIVPD